MRHISRTRALIFVVDAAGSEGRNPAQDLRCVRDELRLYDERLAEKPALVVANKMDLPGELIDYVGARRKGRRGRAVAASVIVSLVCVL